MGKNDNNVFHFEGDSVVEVGQNPIPFADVLVKNADFLEEFLSGYSSEREVNKFLWGFEVLKYKLKKEIHPREIGRNLPEAYVFEAMELRYLLASMFKTQASGEEGLLLTDKVNVFFFYQRSWLRRKRKEVVHVVWDKEKHQWDPDFCGIDVHAWTLNGGAVFFRGQSLPII